ncbi:MotA/TolQ/ExbB proton channel family protein [Schlesneria paludicola]|uniref:MotA/TolQ/ExbB proton channel family protein n=1 Tax=Schlesneria paludicola TaxID=360056 RepID=UPI000299FC82|nr:MotA/TolQ/ExbB proton channel family protein [Schlesneria paludicola]
MFEIIQSIMYAFSHALLWPCCVMLILGVVHTLYLFGGLLVECFQRRGEAKAFSDRLKPPLAMVRRTGIARYLRQCEKDQGCPAWLAIDRTEASLAATVDRARFWIRIGPALGLIGTLIPLGPALKALAENNLKGLSAGLMLSFGTTVFGLFSGSLAWVIANTQERWYRLDLAEVRHAVEESDA